MTDQALVLVALVAAFALFVWGRWRYDLVALGVLLALVLAGIVAPDSAFTGFGHPAVITVAAILVVSRGLGDSGVVEVLAGFLDRVGDRPTVQVGALTALVTLCSAFMNNVGALALLMPVAVRMASRRNQSPSLLLMPLAFGSLLGGMTTLIGTPPNIIIGTFRAEVAEEPFRLFDFAPVGLAVAATGVAFLAFLGWRFIPLRQGAGETRQMFRIPDYTVELRVPEGAEAEGIRLDALAALESLDVVVVRIVRGESSRLAPAASEVLHAGDSLMVEVDPDRLPELLAVTGLELADDHLDAEALRSEEVALVEAVVLPGSLLVGRTAVEARLRTARGMNLVAVARQGERLRQRLKFIRFEPGDVLLGQVRQEALASILEVLGCLPLATRDLSLSRPRRLALALGIFGAAIAALVAGVTSAPVAFTAAALAMVGTGLVRLREIYTSIDWPVVVLLAAMIPVGEAFEATGGAARLAGLLGSFGQQVPLAVALSALLVVTMILSDVMNNAATAVIMAPVGIGLAASLGASPDAFLMAVAVGASCAFMTPIGHQSNTLVMGPGGYRFGDYWRVGLPLQVLILLVAVPLLLLVWGGFTN